MELSDFIYKTLLDIKDGIKRANKDDASFYINANPQVVNFKIAVEVKQEKSTEKGGGIKIHVIEGKLGGESKDSESNVSKIDFTVGIKKVIQ